MPEQTSTSVASDSTTNTGSTSTATSEERTGTHDKSTTLPEDDADGADVGTLPLDQTFELLKNQRRRYVVEHLESSSESVSLGDLAEQIAAKENDKDVKQITSSERKRVYVGLYQCHLPKMDDMDVVSFNKPRGIIESSTNMHSLQPYLDIDETTSGSDSNKYLIGACVLGTGLLPVAILLQTQSLLAVFATVLVIVALTAIAFAHLTRDGDA